ncbi:hypothetical protein RJ639_010202 [Escallonia herrerae]|uniref:HMA domain-containing protein n=1 Tax=Escallonia herrerae TaxID=1293975 RepID=A0AA88VTI0_9ASTE|nr:hypothetical protein RJ639_010202 [Escallonia herrerae]
MGEVSNPLFLPRYSVSPLFSIKKQEEAKVEAKKPEEAKKPKEDKKEEAKPDKAPGDGKKEEGKTEESNESKDPPPPPPPPPQEIVLRVFMHCEGCARKVRRCLKGFEGVEDVQTDCKTHKVVVKGEKADPLKVLGRVQRKSHRQVELLSPIPKPAPAEEPKKEQPPKPEEKKEEPPQVITVVLKVHMHCEACAQEIKKRIQRMKEPDLKSSQVTVKGVFEPPQLVEYVYKRTGKHAVIVKQEPEKKEEEDKGKDGKAEKKAEEGEKKAAEGGGGDGDGGKEKKESGGEEVAKAEPNPEETTVVELKKNEYYYYPQNYPLSYPPNYPPQNVQFYTQRFATESYAYPPAPQMFSDENPNACSVM